MYDNYSSGGCRDNRPDKFFNNAGLTLLLLLFSQNLLRLPFMMVQQVYSLFGGAFQDSALLRLAPYAVYLVSMLLTVLVGRYLSRQDSNFVFPMAEVRRDYFAPAVLSALGVAMLASLAVTVVSALLGTVGIYSRENMPSFDGGVVVTVITIVCSTVLPAILEELLFRGLLLQPLRRYGDRLAVVVSSLLFALAHPTLPQAINAFVIGLALGTLAVRSGSLTVSMTVHFIYNCIACFISLIGAYHPLVGGMTSWVVTILLIIVGCAAMATLHNRFGVVWRLSRDGEPQGGIMRSAVTSIPLVAAAVLCIVEIIRNLYYLPIGGIMP